MLWLISGLVQDYDDTGLALNVLLMFLVVSLLGGCGCWAKFAGAVQLQVTIPSLVVDAHVLMRLRIAGDSCGQLRWILSVGLGHFFLFACFRLSLPMRWSAVHLATQRS